MARPAPAVERTVALMTYLAEHAGTPFTLSELARSLDINKATMHSLLGTLTDAGWITRDPAGRGYRLGPGLIAIANTEGAARRAALNAVRQPMRELAAEYNVRCVASAVIDGHVLVLAAEGRPSPAGVAAEVGYRVPLAPPLGTVFLAWADAETQQRWLRQETPDTDVLARYQAAFEAVRTRGYSLTHQIDARQRVTQALAELASRPSREARNMVRRLLEQLEQDERERVVVEIPDDDVFDEGLLSAPVFDAAGGVVLALGLIGFPSPLRGGEVRALAACLVEAARSVTEAINGVAP